MTVHYVNPRPYKPLRTIVNTSSLNNPQYAIGHTNCSNYPLRTGLRAFGKRSSAIHIWIRLRFVHHSSVPPNESNNGSAWLCQNSIESTWLELTVLSKYDVDPCPRMKNEPSCCTTGRSRGCPSYNPLVSLSGQSSGGWIPLHDHRKNWRSDQRGRFNGDPDFEAWPHLCNDSHVD